MAVASVCLLAIGGYAFTADQRAFYCDDYALRLMVVEHGWPGAYVEFTKGWGFARPLGVLNILAWYRWLWDSPIVVQMLMAGLFAATALLFYALLRDATGDIGAATAGAATFAAWHSFTSVVAWTSAGGGMLPAAALLAAALLWFVRSDRCATAKARGKLLAWSVLLFGTSLLFYDQQIGAVAVFTAFALIGPGEGRAWRRVVRSVPFWAAALAIGSAYAAASVHTDRPLHPDLRNVVGGLGTVAASAWRTMVWQPGGQWMKGSGAIGSLERYWREDAGRLTLTIAASIAGCIAAGAAAWRTRPAEPTTNASRRLVVGGALLLLVTVAIIAASDARPVLDPRHTMMPAMGVAMMIAGAFAALRRARVRRAGAAMVVVALGALSLTRAGEVYAWSIRTRVLNKIVASLAAWPPHPEPGELIVVDGVRQYGRGFTSAWGLSSALTMNCGVRVRVTTLVRAANGKLIGNDEREIAWPVTSRARFCVWDERRQSLRASTLGEYLSRHPAVAAGIDRARDPCEESPRASPR